MPSLEISLVKKVIKNYNSINPCKFKYFIETGTYRGDTINSVFDSNIFQK